MSAGDKKERGFGVLARESLVQRIIYAWTASAPQFLPLIKQKKVEAYNLPLGIISHLTRSIAAGSPGLATKVVHDQLYPLAEPGAGGAADLRRPER